MIERQRGSLDARASASPTKIGPGPGNTHQRSTVVAIQPMRPCHSREVSTAADETRHELPLLFAGGARSGAGR